MSTQTQLHTNTIILKTTRQIHSVLANIRLHEEYPVVNKLFLLNVELRKTRGLTEIFLNKLLHRF